LHPIELLLSAVPSEYRAGVCRPLWKGAAFKRQKNYSKRMVASITQALNRPAAEEAEVYFFRSVRSRGHLIDSRRAISSTTHHITVLGARIALHVHRLIQTAGDAIYRVSLLDLVCEGRVSYRAVRSHRQPSG